jgi:uncharacterized membrane protein YeaQ/YmgE (transglycosylase-associated protein family)
MNPVMWLLAGAALAWLAFSYLNVNSARGLVMALVIGAISAYFGGSVLAPLFSDAVHAAGEFKPFALLVAAASAAACLLITDMVYDRFGV